MNVRSGASASNYISNNIDEQEDTESKFKTEVEEKVQNDNVKLESFTDVDVDEKTEPDVTESK